MNSELTVVQVEALETVKQDVYWTRPRCAFIFISLRKRGLVLDRSIGEMQAAAAAKGTTWDKVSQYKLA